MPNGIYGTKDSYKSLETSQTYENNLFVHTVCQL